MREMYAWDIALFKSGVQLELTKPPTSPLIAQPPHDPQVGAAAMFHYTWGAIYNDTKGEVWRFEKRDYTSKEHALKVPHLPMPPQPWRAGWVLQDRSPVTEQLHATLTDMVGQMNKAISTLRDLTVT